MSVATFIGRSVIGSSAAYAKHAAIATGVGTTRFATELVSSTVEGYHSKDAQLAARRKAALAAFAAKSAAPTAAEVVDGVEPAKSAWPRKVVVVTN